MLEREQSFASNFFESLYFTISYGSLQIFFKRLSDYEWKIMNYFNSYRVTHLCEKVCVIIKYVKKSYLLKLIWSIQGVS